MPFVLEVVRFIRDRDEWMAKGGKEEHVGYMRAHFRKKKDAASYYDRHNPLIVTCKYGSKCRFLHHGESQRERKPNHILESMIEREMYEIIKHWEE